MGQVYLSNYKGPLYAYVEFSVGGVVATTGNNPSLVNSLGSGFEKCISNVVMSLAVQRKSSSEVPGMSLGGVGNEFNIVIFDETAAYMEDIIANAITAGNASGVNCEIEYGWAAGGKKIPERCLRFQGILIKYTLSFEGPSTSLSIEGTSQGDIDISRTYTNASLPDEVSSGGTPSDIVKEIFNHMVKNEGGVTYKFDDTTIVQSLPVNINGQELANYTLNNQTLFSYITKVLCPNARTSDGQCGFRFYFTQDDNDHSVMWVHFDPMTDVVKAKFNVTNEEGEVITEYSANYDGSSSRIYNYYADAQNNEVLSFSVDSFFGVVDASAGTTSAVDSVTNEFIMGEADGSYGKGLFGKKGTIGVSKRVFGLSASDYETLGNSMVDLWNKYAAQTITASLEILGDPRIHIMGAIDVNVYTKYGLKHHTSGKYLVESVEDSVDSSGFTSSLTLTKLAALGSPTTQHATADTTIRYTLSGVSKSETPKIQEAASPVVSSKIKKSPENLKVKTSGKNIKNVGKISKERKEKNRNESVDKKVSVPIVYKDK